MKSFISKTEKQTIRWAKKFIRNKENCVILLDGSMGAGKTAIVRGFANGLKINQPITSPTFTLINEYKGVIPLYHFDLYRLNHEDELLSLGLDEYLQSKGIKVFEWGSKFNVFPDNALKINVEIIDEKKRKINYYTKIQ